ncbi:anthranilate synthase component 1 (plasmid) [Buchnera aphidicola (Taiwanaphis decaspermi)]|uniref:anthranilate synthase component 1 n=1 Tax=Buchnera aphidicola TaxID=9 RepID=UPI0031B8722D
MIIKKIKIIEKSTKYHSNPTLIFNSICEDKKYTLLLESSEVKTKKNLTSMMIIDSAVRITCEKNIVKIKSLTENGKIIIDKIRKLISNKIKTKYFKNDKIKFFFKKKKNIDEDEDTKLKSESVFDSLRYLIELLKTNNSKKNEKIFFGGLFSYELINNFEKIKYKNKNEKLCPDFCFYLSEILLTFNHKKKKCFIQGIVLNKNKIIEKKIKNRINFLIKKLSKKQKKIKREIIKKINYQKNVSDEKYIKIIKKMKKKIKKGDIFQVVPSRKFFIPCKSHLLSYNELKKKNPSPYMFYMQDKEFILFGSSPESSLKFDPKNRNIEIHPIAGTRKRGFKKNGEIDLDLDSRIELEMRTDKKEIAEHLMLVDLARNDLARICEKGTRYVSDLIKVEKYSFVMHLVSRVVGKLKKELDVFHAYRACMNMGTLTGAPKIKAMQLISKYEKEKRGIYGGSIGYFTSSGLFDTSIIIRSAFIKNNIATIQSGAGIVLDSIPELESKESINKAKAVLLAIINTHSKKRK